MRLFIALELPDPIRRQIETFAKEIQSRISDPRKVIRWVKPDQYHITLKFMGECQDSVLTRLTLAMSDTARRHVPFGLGFREVGSFRGGKTMRTLWLGTEDGTDRAKALAADLRLPAAPQDSRPMYGPITRI